MVLTAKADQAQLGAVVGWTCVGIGAGLGLAAALTSLATNWDGDVDALQETP